MDDLIGRLVANSGDRTAAERAVGIIPQLLRREERSLTVRAVVGCRPRADATLSASNPSSRSTLSTIGGLVGVGGKSTTVVRSTKRIQLVACETMSAARETMGKMQSAAASARFPASASLSDAR
jgi:hypothetical protein